MIPELFSEPFYIKVLPITGQLDRDKITAMLIRLTICFIFFGLNIHSIAGAQSKELPDSVEQQLILIITAIQQAQWEQARQLSRALANEHPNWKPAAMLNSHIDHHTLPMFIPPKPIKIMDDEFDQNNLTAELHQRWQYHSQTKQNQSLVPEPLVRLADSIKNIILVDLAKSRLFLLQHSHNELSIAADYYAGIGKQGIGKQIVGDHRTPVGIYTITSKIPDRELDELYGIGAMPLDYPNAWDKRRQRTGSGIWLHGVPRSTYSRTPFSSRGCVTVSNTIFHHLMKIAEIKNTPVILSESINWLTKEDAKKQQQLFSALIEAWRNDWNSLDFNRYIAHYSDTFHNGLENFSVWKDRKQHIQKQKQFIHVELSSINIYRYPGEKDLIKFEYRQQYQSNNYNDDVNQLQFWQQESDGQWRIIYEGSQ